MGREHLADRDNWQAMAQFDASRAEWAFDAVMRAYCEGTRFEYRYKPDDLREIYGRNPDTGRLLGIEPEAAIRNRDTGRAIFVEVKRQGKGGNAHERACKYFAPGIMASARSIANQPADVIPFWWVFTEELANKSTYVLAITHWFRGAEGNSLLWKDMRDYEPVLNHFERYIAPMLD